MTARSTKSRVLRRVMARGAFPPGARPCGTHAVINQLDRSHLLDRALSVFRHDLRSDRLDLLPESPVCQLVAQIMESQAEGHLIDRQVPPIRIFPSVLEPPQENGIRDHCHWYVSR